MVRKLTFSSASVLAWAVVLVAALFSLSCGSSMDPVRSAAAAASSGGSNSGGSGSGGSGGSGSAGSSKVELTGPIEELTPATGTPTALRTYGVTANIQAAQIVLEREGEGENENEAETKNEDKISLDPRDLATTQFVEVEFMTPAMADKVEVRAGEAEGTLQNLVTFSPAPTVTVNRNSRMISATFTVAGAGILCDSSFTRVQVDGLTGSCAQLVQLNGVNVEVHGLVVHNLMLSLADLKTTVSPRDVILAARVQRD